jgi:serine/threonine-protein kinase HipA
LPQTAEGVPASTDFLDNQLRAAPPITSLAELHAISHAVESDDWQSVSVLNADDPTHADQRRWLAQLVAPGSSLGGARPKANFTHTDGSLWIAKFPSREDRRNVAAWEMLLHTLAQQSGITVPPAELLYLNRSSDSHSYPSFAVQRFDRYFESASPADIGAPIQQRLLFVSAMTLLQTKDGERHHSYCDLAHFIAQHGAAGCVEMDLEQLFRRVVFNILTSNRDDHLRNHGFIRYPSGWRLSPAFDLNPNPEKYDHALAIAPQGAAHTIATAIATAQQYRLSVDSATAIAQRVAQTVGTWRQHCPALGLTNSEIERMAAAFLA